MVKNNAIKQMARNILGEYVDKGKKNITYEDMKAKCICLQCDDTERKGRKKSVNVFL